MDRTTTSLLTDFLSDITVAESAPEGFAALARAIEAMGFGAVAYTAIPLTLTAVETPEPTFLASPDFSRGFLEHYGEANLARHDFTIERIRAGQMAVMDWREEGRQGRLNADQQAVVDLASADYGIRSALSLPTRSDEHVIAGASVVSDDTAARFRLLKRERLETLRAVTALFHDWTFSVPERRRRFYEPLLGQLSAGERRVIRLVTGGQRLKCSRELCGISPTRAGNILSALYKRLGISNAHELAYLVGVHQIARWL